MSFKGSTFRWEDIFHHSQATLTSEADSEIEFIEVQKKEDVEVIIEE